jgi:hypothetical protein
MEGEELNLQRLFIAKLLGTAHHQGRKEKIKVDLFLSALMMGHGPESLAIKYSLVEQNACIKF